MICRLEYLAKLYGISAGGTASYTSVNLSDTVCKLPAELSNFSFKYGFLSRYNHIASQVMIKLRFENRKAHKFFRYLIADIFRIKPEGGGTLIK